MANSEIKKINSVWRSMRDRCTNPKNPSFGSYGGRGISVCGRWSSFDQFLLDMGQRPAGYSIERIDNDGNYEPRNCHWASAKEQAMNRRVAGSVAIGGESLSFAELSRRVGISAEVLRARIKSGRTVLEAIVDPVRHTRHHKGIFVGAMEARSLRHASKIAGISYDVLRKRLKAGWSVDRALHLPVRGMKGVSRCA